ncbi:hypothetical protein ACFPRL_09570 [Pseudoclavibacter helvolus]
MPVPVRSSVPGRSTASSLDQGRLESRTWTARSSASRGWAPAHPAPRPIFAWPRAPVRDESPVRCQRGRRSVQPSIWWLMWIRSSTRARHRPPRSARQCSPGRPRAATSSRCWTP